MATIQIPELYYLQLMQAGRASDAEVCEGLFQKRSITLSMVYKSEQC